MSDVHVALAAMIDVARTEKWYMAPEGSPAREAYAKASEALQGSKPKEQLVTEKPKAKKKGK